MSRKFAALLAAALTLGALALTAEAQQHKATRLGNPATRFAKPLKKADDLRVLLRAEKLKADVAAVLADVGWAGDAADLDRAAAAAEISPIQIPNGTRLPVHGGAQEGQAVRDARRALGGQEADRRVRLRVHLQVRALPARDAEGLQQLLGRGDRQGHDERGLRAQAGRAAAGRERERRVERLRHPAGRLHDHRQEPAVRQQRDVARERQGAGDRQALERQLPLHLHRRRGRPARYEIKAVSGGVAGVDQRRGQALRSELRHHGDAAAAEGRQALHRGPLRLARRRRRQGRPQVREGRGAGREGCRDRDLRDARGHTDPQRRGDQEGRHPHAARGGDGRGQPGLDQRLHRSGRREGRLPDLRRAATSARSA